MMVAESLSLTSQQLVANLHRLVDCRIDHYNSYLSFKICTSKDTKRRYLTDLLLALIQEFLGTDYNESYANIIRSKCGTTPIKDLEYKIDLLSQPNPDWNQQCSVIRFFGLKIPSQDFDIDQELNRFGVGTVELNHNIKFHFCVNRSFYNLVESALITANTDNQYISASNLMKHYLSLYYDQMNIKIDFSSYSDYIFDQKGCSGDWDEMPYLPKLPKGFKYSHKFYDQIRRQVAIEYSLFRFEWSWTRVYRFNCHDLLIDELDLITALKLYKCIDLDQVLALTCQNDERQNIAVELLVNQICNYAINSYLNYVKPECESYKTNLRQLYHKKTIKVTKRIISVFKKYRFYPNSDFTIPTSEISLKI